MPRAYSDDLRQRVIAACEAGTATRIEIAQQFQISETMLYEWLQRWRTSGSVSARPHAGGGISHLDATVLCTLIEQNNDRTLEEYAHLYAEQTGRRFHPSCSTPRGSAERARA